tara:strand:+ start:1860 stop:2468 length:609 start_codon:yes stop_codon:yes gene_type:complete
MKWLIVALSSMYLMGCVSPLSVEESAPQVNMPNETAEVSFAVLDQRPYVLDEDKQADFEGIIRSSIGIPYSHSTVTREPMATYLGKRLEHGMKQKGVEVEQYPTTINTQFSDIVSKLNKDGKPSILFVLNEWKYDFHAFSDSSWYDVDVIASDKTGEKVVTKKFAGENDIPDSGAIMNEMMLIYKARFEKIFADPELRAVLK